MTIVNPKIAHIQPHGYRSKEWTPAPFRGWSYLFNNPGASLGEEQGLPFIACNINDPNGFLRLYEVLSTSLKGLEKELRQCRLLLLDPASYHVTLWDGINNSNIAEIEEPERSQHHAFLKELPASITGPLPPSLPSPVVCLPKRWSIEFRFSKMSIWTGAYALVAEIEPVDDASKLSLRLLTEHRQELDKRFKVIKKPEHAEWTPHITLAYFENRNDAERAMECLPQWSKAIADQIGETSIKFSSASLFAFTDMERFWDCRLPGTIVRLQDIRGAILSKLGVISSRGDQKIVITYQYPTVERLGQIQWRPLAENGKRHYENLAKY